jgi:hypothetical protein
MTIPQRSGNGLLIRRGPETRTFLRYVEESLPPVRRLDDGHLVAVLLRRTNEELQTWVTRAEATGMVRNSDFTLMDDHGRVPDVPPWLLAVLEPTGNPPELEAKMDPEVRAMWQDSRRWSYRLVGT